MLAFKPTRIDAQRESEIEYWARRWCVAAFEVRRAIDCAGPLVADVERCVMAWRRSSPSAPQHAPSR